MANPEQNEKELPRLKRRSDFLRVARTGSKWVTKGLVMQAAPQRDYPSENVPRVGFTVSKKVGNAVKRNRARRRLKAAAQQVMPTQAAAAIDYVLIGRHTTLNRPWKKLVGDMETALKRITIEDR